MTKNNQNLNSPTQPSFTNNNPVGIEGNIALIGTALVRAFNFVTRSGVSTKIKHPKLRGESTNPDKYENILSKKVTDALFSEPDTAPKDIDPAIKDIVDEQVVKPLKDKKKKEKKNKKKKSINKVARRKMKKILRDL